MNVSSDSRSRFPRWLLGLAAVVILGSVASSDVFVSGNLTVSPGTATVSWTGSIDVGPGSSSQTINGTLDIGGQVPATFFGLHVNAFGHWPSVPFGTLRMHNSCLDPIHDGNHPCAFWYDVERSNQQFDWRAFDGYMAALDAHPGTSALYTFSYIPPFAADQACVAWDIEQRRIHGPECAQHGFCCVYEGSCCPAKETDGDMVEWRDFVAQVVRRAAGRIKFYELWNEPNFTNSWCSDTAHGCDSLTEPRKLVKMARIAYQTIHQLDPTAVVLTPSSVINDNRDCGSSTAWLAGYLAAGGGQWADAIAFHGYLQGVPGSLNCDVPDIIPEHVQGGIRNLRALLESYGLASKPIWDTEASFLSAINDEDERSAWVARAYLMRWSEGVQRYAFYGWDYAPDGELWDNGILPDGIAFGELYKWLVGATMTSPCTLDGVLWSCPLIRSNGAYKAVVVWKSSMDTTVTSYTAPSGYIHYRDLTGGAGTVAGSMNIGRKPVLFETTAIP